MRRRGRHRKRRKYSISVDHPVVFYACGFWFRSGHPSTYDRWPIHYPLNDYQRKLVTR